MHLDAFGHVLTHLDVFGRIWTGFGQVWTGFGRVWKVSGGVWRSLEEFEEVFKQISYPCPPELQEYEVAKSMDFGHLKYLGLPSNSDINVDTKVYQDFFSKTEPNSISSMQNYVLCMYVFVQCVGQ